MGLIQLINTETLIANTTSVWQPIDPHMKNLAVQTTWASATGTLDATLAIQVSNDPHATAGSKAVSTVETYTIDSATNDSGDDEFISILPSVGYIRTVFTKNNITSVIVKSHLVWGN